MKKSNDMAYRPYFKHGIEQIQELVASSRDDLKALKVIQDELGFRNRPKAHVLKVEVDDLVRRLSAGAAEPPARRVPTPPQPPRVMMPEPPVVQPPPAAPDRVELSVQTAKPLTSSQPLKGLCSIFRARPANRPITLNSSRE